MKFTLAIAVLMVFGGVGISSAQSAVPAIISQAENWPKQHISVSYPRIVGRNGAASRAFNQAVMGWVHKRLAAFRQDRVGLKTSDETIRYRVLLASPNVVSIEFQEDNYFGGPYPNTEYAGLTFDLLHGHAMSLDSIFRPGVNAKKELMIYCRQALRELGPDEPREADWVGWAMTPHRIIVYFDLPHVAAVFDRVSVPNSSLTNLIAFP